MTSILGKAKKELVSLENTKNLPAKLEIGRVSAFFDRFLNSKTYGDRNTYTPKRHRLPPFTTSFFGPSSFTSSTETPGYSHVHSDVVPIALQMINVANPLSVLTMSSWRTDLYAYSTFTFYVLQVSLMILSIRVVMVKSKQVALLQANPVRGRPRFLRI